MMDLVVEQMQRKMAKRLTERLALGILIVQGVVHITRLQLMRPVDDDIVQSLAPSG